MQRVIAFFVTPHGLGHAARAAAVIDALYRKDAELSFLLFTAVPPWFFQESTPAPFIYHEARVDVGMSQTDAIRVDLDATLCQLDSLLNEEGAMIEALSAQLRELHADLVVCDIAPLGIAAARAAGRPSVLIENFTWDWIYQAFVRRDHRFQAYVDKFRERFSSADYRIRVSPVCGEERGQWEIPPISRRMREPPATVRHALGLPPDRPLVLFSMGGLSWHCTWLDRLTPRSEVTFVIAGGGNEARRLGDNVLVLPRRGVYHPDLIGAAELVVAKVGYSTVAEAFQAGAPLGYVRPKEFPEGRVLEGFIKQAMSGLQLRAEAIETGAWIDRLPALLKLERTPSPATNGADHAAQIILQILGDKKP